MKRLNQLAVLTVCISTRVLPVLAAESQTLPWQREIPLWEAAQSVILESTLNPTDPNSRSTMSINNLKMLTVLWGPPNQITISLTKNNVWDRRRHEFQAPTLEEMMKALFLQPTRTMAARIVTCPKPATIRMIPMPRIF
jgi:hypothetical protein